MAKKKKGMSPTFKAGLIIIILLFVIWGVLGQTDAWYVQPVGVVEEAVEPIDIVRNETKEAETEEVLVVNEEVTQQEEVAEVEEETIEPTIEALLDDNFDYNIDPMTLEDGAKYWSYRPNAEHTPVEGYNMNVELKDYDAFFKVDTDAEVVYLTFDEGYELGYTESILDTLSANGIQAAFFVTESYVRSSPELVKRMKEEGHIVGNHSVHHYDGVSGDGTLLTDVSTEVMIDELVGVETAMMEETGYPIDLFFRPPGGKFNDRTLYTTRQQGYKTIFWSMAYQDWYTDNQPGKEAAYNQVMNNYFPGQIILLHAVSESNTQALDDIIKGITDKGYRFGSLYEIPSYFE